MVRRSRLERHVDFVVQPDDVQLADLYRGACLLLFPSLYEGFGLPPLEAMAFGCPVVCSSAASLPEVVGRAALTCPPDDEEQMAGNCERILEDPALAERLIELGHRRARKFTLKRMAQGLLDAYAEALGE